MMDSLNPLFAGHFFKQRGNIYMEIELMMAEDVVEYIREIVKARMLPPESVSRIVANVVTALFNEADAATHLDGVQFGRDVQQIMAGVDRSSETGGEP